VDLRPDNAVANAPATARWASLRRDILDAAAGVGAALPPGDNLLPTSFSDIAFYNLKYNFERRAMPPPYRLAGARLSARKEVTSD
jgi:hypothetical protein